MDDIYCTKCGRLHDSSEKQCLFCGNNLEREFERFRRRAIEEQKSNLDDYQIFEQTSGPNVSTVEGALNVTSRSPGSKNQGRKYRIKRK